jgi:hypothetical protein
MITGEMIMKPEQLACIFKEAVNLATLKMLAESGLQKARISKAEAYRLYGRSQVDRWISEGLFEPFETKIYTSQKGIDRVKLEAIAADSNRTTYLPVAER